MKIGVAVVLALLLLALLAPAAAVAQGAAAFNWATLTYERWRSLPEGMRGAFVMGAMNMMGVLGQVSGKLACPSISAWEVRATLETSPPIVETDQKFGVAVLAAMGRHGCTIGD